MASNAKVENSQATSSDDGKMIKADDKQVRRVFQGLVPNMPTQIVTYSVNGEKPGERPVCRVIDQNRAGQFVLSERAPYYAEQLAALRRYCERHSGQLKEVASKEENKPPEAFAPKPADPMKELQEAKIREAENSELVTQLNSAVMAKDREIAELKKQLSAK